jgi:tetratricopeptide (TPR) repeat protein
MKRWLIFCFISVFITTLFICCQEKEVSNQFTTIGFEYFEKSKVDSLSHSDKKKYLEKAFSRIDNKQNDSLYLKMLHYKVHLLGIEKSYDSAEIILRNLIFRAKKAKDSSTLGKAYFIKGLFHSKQQKIDSAYFYYEKSKDVFVYLNDSIQVARRLLNIAIIELEHGDYSQSDFSSIEALKYLNHKNMLCYRYQKEVKINVHRKIYHQLKKNFFLFLEALQLII